MDNNQKLKQVYNNWGPTYDSEVAHNIAHIKIHPAIINMLKKEPDLNKGLDLGCGTGILTIEASRYSKEIIGLDFSEKMLDEARKKKSLGAKLEFVGHDLTQSIPFEENTFDYVLAVLVLHHLEDLEKIYREIYRVLKPNGFLIFDEFVTKPQTQEQLDHPMHVNYPDPLTDAKKSGIKVWHIRYLDEHKKILQKIGFEIEEITTTYFDKELEPHIENFKYHEGRIFAYIVKARKS